jgi:transposase-like protein
MKPSALLTEKQHFWQQHVLQTRSYNGSLADYAKQHQLKANTLYYWVNIFKRTAQPKQAAVGPVSFSAVRMPSPTPASYYQLHLPSRLTLQCAALPDPQWLAELSRQLDAST